MSAFLDFDFRLGSKIDKTGTFSSSGGKGLIRNSTFEIGGTSTITVGDLTDSLPDDFTIIAFIPNHYGTLSSYKPLLSKANFTSGNYGFTVRIDYGNNQVNLLYSEDGGTSLRQSKFNYPTGTNHHLKHTLTIRKSGTEAKVYYNRTLMGTNTLTGSILNKPNEPIRLFFSKISSRSYGRNCSRIYIDDTALSESEISDFVTEFENSQIISSPKRNFIYPKPTDLSDEDGLVTAYNMIPTGGKILDISGNGNDGDIGAGIISRERGLYFKRSETKTIQTPQQSIITNTGTYTICGRFKQTNNTNFQLICFNYLGSNERIALQIVSNKLCFIKFNGTYNDSVAQTLRNVGEYTDFVAVSTNGVLKIYINGDGGNNTTASGSLSSTPYFLIGGDGSSTRSFDGIIEEIKVYNKALTEQEAIDYHNSFANEIYLYENFEGNGADGLDKLPNGWSNQGRTGSWAINELSMGEKYMSILSSGVIGLPSKQAYGTWEFDVKPYASSGGVQIHFIAQSVITRNSGDNYNITFASDNVIRVGRKTIWQLINSTTGYIDGESYSMKITRNYSNSFNVYIKGGEYGNDYVLLSADTGSNPFSDSTYTTSNYFNVEMYNTSSQIKNIVLKKGIAVPSYTSIIPHTLNMKATKLKLKEEGLLTGDILVCRRKTLLSKVIRKIAKSGYSHSATYINGYVYGSQIRGAQKLKFEDWLQKYDYEFEVYRNEEVNKELITKRAESKLGTKYDFLSLLFFQLIYNLTGKWWGLRREKAIKRLYCFEYTAWIFNFDNWWKMSPQDFYNKLKNNSKFKQIKIK